MEALQQLSKEALQAHIGELEALYEQGKACLLYTSRCV